MEENRLITAREAARILGISVRTFWRRVADRGVPQPVKIGHASRWDRAEILDMIVEAKKRRDTA